MSGLKDNPLNPAPVTRKTLTGFCKTPSSFRALIENGLLDLYELETGRLPHFSGHIQEPPVLSQAQQKSLTEIKESFSEVPKFYVELQDKELRSLDVLCDIGGKVYGESDPDEVLFKKEIYIVDKENKTLSIYLPFAEKDELELKQQGRELSVGVKNESRVFPVPEEFSEMEISGAKFAEGYLKISFAAGS